MLTGIRLNGALGKQFGRKWALDVETPAEAVRALEALKPGFLKAILDLDGFDFRVKVGKEAIGKELLLFPNRGKTITITPVLKGSGNTGKGVGEIILGVVLVVVGVVVAVVSEGTASAAATQLILAGVGLIAGGIAVLLAPSPPSVDQNPDDIHKASYQFNGPINTIQQGAPVPYCAGGPIIIGSAVVSAGVSNADVLAASETGSGSTSNEGGGPVTRVPPQKQEH